MMKDEVFEAVADFAHLKLKALQREDWDTVESLSEALGECLEALGGEP